jgi:Flp pilus assembly pilin Flp
VKITSAIRRQRDQRGSSASEYALMLTVVAVCILAAVALFGTRTDALFHGACESVASTQRSAC